MFINFVPLHDCASIGVYSSQQQQNLLYLHVALILYIYFLNLVKIHLSKVTCLLLLFFLLEQDLKVSSQ